MKSLSVPGIRSPLFAAVYHSYVRSAAYAGTAPAVHSIATDAIRIPFAFMMFPQLIQTDPP